MPYRIPIGLSHGRKVFLTPERRSEHLHVVGGSRKGKSRFLEHLIREDLLKGHGLVLIDPHGEVYDNTVNFCAAKNIDNFRTIHLIDPARPDWCTGFNPLCQRPGEPSGHRVENTIEALSAAWSDEDTLSMPAIHTAMQVVFRTLYDSGMTLAESFALIMRDDPDAIRSFVTANVTDRVQADIWREYADIARRSPKDFSIEFGGLRRRMTKVLLHAPLRTMLGQIETAIDFRQVMEKGEVVLVNLSAKHLHMELGRVLGAMIVRELFFIATQRDVRTANRSPCYLYVDECARFLTEDIADLLTQTAKFGLHATLAHQNLAQMETESPKVYGAMMGIQNKVIFGGLYDEDARILADELFRTEYDIEKPVEALKRPVAVGTRKIWLSSWSESSSENESTTENKSTTESESHGTGEPVDEDGYPTTETTYSTSTTAMSTTESSSHSRSSSRTSSEGASEAFETVYKDMTTAVHSLQTIQHLATARLRALPARNAVVRGSAQQTFDIVTFDISPSVVAPSTRDAFIERTMKRSVYSVPVSVAKKTVEERIEGMVKRAKQWKSPRSSDGEPEEWRG